MDKYFELKQKGFKLKLTKKNNNFVVCGSCGKIFLESSGEDLEEALEKFYDISKKLFTEIF